MFIAIALRGIVSNMACIVFFVDEDPHRLVVGRRRWHGRQVRKDISRLFTMQTCRKFISRGCPVLLCSMDMRPWLPENGEERESLRHWKARQMDFQECMVISDCGFVHPRPSESMRPERMPEWLRQECRKWTAGLDQLHEVEADQQTRTP